MKKKLGILVVIMVFCIIFVVMVVRYQTERRNEEIHKEELMKEEMEIVSTEEALNQMRQRYGEDVELLEANDSDFLFLKKVKTPVEGEITFYVQQDAGILIDNYYEELYRYTGTAYFNQTGRTITWEETGEAAYKSYVPIFQLQGGNDDNLRWFCTDVCDFIEYCQAVESLGNDPKFMNYFLIAHKTLRSEFSSTVAFENYDRNDLFNKLYLFAETLLLSEEAIETQDTDRKEFEEPLETMEQEIIELYFAMEADCIYKAEDGMEYRLVGVDRAAGSSYYVLLGTYDHGATCAFLNTDPFNGNGGTAKWLSFLNEKIGFSCLAYSGGNYGSLYRTEDGGRTFTEIKYPSAKILLSDNTYYNPFVMPQQVYEEDGKLFLVVGQGPDGDYYNENKRCMGLYVSKDLGITWEYVGETGSPVS